MNDVLNVAPSSRISPLADLEFSSRGTKIVIGNNTVIDSFVKIKCVGGYGDIVIGNDCYINSGCVIYSGNGVIIGDHCMIAANCVLAPVNHNYSSKEKLIKLQGFMDSRGGVFIGNDSWIGAGSVLLDGAYVSEGCVVGASSLVKAQLLPPYTIWGGNPLQQIGRRI